jgi:formylglycine-generating enzyme required for sulfatase activity
MVNWNDAGAVCARNRKRLCTEAEWTFACEGDEATPYPYGYQRDPDACVVDRPWRAFKADALFPTGTARARAELDRLWQGEASGARPRCRSPFGVYDMTGNVDEWTTSIVPGERPSILKGGYWGPVRTRCRPSTRAHGQDYLFYQQGFRCCGDAPPATASVTSPRE